MHADCDQLSIFRDIDRQPLAQHLHGDVVGQCRCWLISRIQEESYK